MAGDALAVEHDQFAGLDVACNVAGIAPEPKPFTDHSLAEWQRTIDVDLTGVFLCTKHAIPQMKKAGRDDAVYR